MGLVAQVYLYCDSNSENCTCAWLNSVSGRMEYSEAHGGDSGHETKKAYKEEAVREGWLFRGRKSYCPECRKAFKDSPNE